MPAAQVLVPTQQARHAAQTHLVVALRLAGAGRLALVLLLAAGQGGVVCRVMCGSGHVRVGRGEQQACHIGSL